MLPSIESSWRGDKRVPPNIRTLYICSPNSLDKKPVAKLIMERRETSQIDSRDGSVYSASITLSYQRVQSRVIGTHRPPGGEFNAKFERYSGMSHAGGTVSLTGGAVYLDLPGLEGHRIGTYLMNEIVEWAMQWPEATVRTIELMAHEGADPANRHRRNRFYEQFGIPFAYTDVDHKEGKSLPVQAKDLNLVVTWRQNISEVALMEHLMDCEAEIEDQGYRIDSSTRSSREWSGAYQYTLDHPMRHAVKVLSWSWGPRLLIAAPILLFILSWLRHHQ